MKVLPAHPNHDLNWEIDINETSFHLDFGWDRLNPYDEGVLNAHLLAVEEFVKKVPHARHVVLARFEGPFATLLTPSERLEEHFKESSLPFEVFCAQLVSDYLHRLASVLPDAMEPIILIDLNNPTCPPDFGAEVSAPSARYNPRDQAKGAEHPIGEERGAVDGECSQRTPKRWGTSWVNGEFPIAEAILSFCKRRFEHFTLKFLNGSLPIDGQAALMVSIPSDDRFCPKAMELIFSTLQGQEYKCIPEELLNEHWEGVDTLIIDPATLGDIGKRMILGFEAAGGEVIRSRGI